MSFQVMSIASNLEPHTRKVHRDDPDYKALYAYMAGILRGEEPPELNPIGKSEVTGNG